MATVKLNAGAWVETAITAATTTDIGAVVSTRILINASGTPSVTSLGVQPYRRRECRAAAPFTLVYNATTLKLPGNVNRNILAGDTFEATSDLSGNWTVFNLAHDDGTPTAVASSGNVLVGSGTQWVSVAISGDLTLTSLGALSIGAAKVTNTMLAGSIAWSKLLGSDITAIAITSASANALAVGLNGATNPALQVDASTASSANGIKIKSTAGGGGVAIAAISSSSNEDLTINAKGTGAIGIGTISTGNITIGNTSVSQIAVIAATTFTKATENSVSDSNITMGGSSGQFQMSLRNTDTTDGNWTGFLFWNGVGSAGVNLSAGIFVQNANHSSGTGVMHFLTSGALSRMHIGGTGGLCLGAPTGDDKGTGTLNAAAGIWVGAALNLKSYTVAGLPVGNTGDTVYATNCRVFNGTGTQEGAAAGTGGIVSYNGTAWKIAGTNVTAVA